MPAVAPDTGAAVAPVAPDGGTPALGPDAGAAGGRSREHLQGISPLWAYGVAAPGTLVLDADWQDGCGDCTLGVSERNSGMSALREGRRTFEPGRVHVEVPATPGLYCFFAQSPTGEHPFLLRARFERTDGVPAVATHHGISWQRMCEG